MSGTLGGPGGLQHTALWSVSSLYVLTICPHYVSLTILVISGGWSGWERWSPCSVTCGGGGTQTRARRCDSPQPSGGGRACRGEREQTRPCEGEDCEVSLPAQCGVRIPGVTQFRVVGGVAAKLHAHPWIAALGYRETGGEVEYKCGGTLVTSRHVITAAHCVTDQLAVVTLGEHNIRLDNDKASPETFNIANITTHGEYNGRNQDNDIAVITLERDVTFNKGIRPVCLPSTSRNLQGDKVR